MNCACSIYSSCPGLSRASTSLFSVRQDVDGRDKPGHDGSGYTCGAAKFSTLTPSRSSMISAIHCRWHSL
jgi:hypothetical protein